MFGDYSPERENTSGARWNPPQTPAIYASLNRDVVLAEADYQIAQQSLRPSARRTIYRIRLKLASVVNLADWSLLAELGLESKAFQTPDYQRSQLIGGCAEWLEHDGLLVPSARSIGVNLVVFPNNKTADCIFEVLDSEIL
jgi:RES domain-containing protein